MIGQTQYHGANIAKIVQKAQKTNALISESELIRQLMCTG